MQSPQLLANLGRAPARSFALELHDQFLDLERQLIRLPVRSSTAIGQSLKPAVLVSLKDLVAGLARDIKLATQHSHFLAIEQTRYKSKPFVHFVTLLPRHFGPPQRPEVLPMCPE
jgi:hypothetical protein